MQESLRAAERRSSLGALPRETSSCGVSQSKIDCSMAGAVRASKTTWRPLPLQL